jgi:hypothetical protein
MLISPVAAAAASPGAAITLQTARVPCTLLRGETPVDPAQSWEAAVSIAAGAPVTQARVHTTPDVAKGSNVRIEATAGALTVAAHAAWSAPAPFWALPGDLRAALARAALALVKGDANYRRLLGDRHWPHADAFARVVGAYDDAPSMQTRSVLPALRSREVHTSFTPALRSREVHRQLAHLMREAIRCNQRNHLIT